MIVCTAGAVELKEAIDRLAVIKFAGFNLIHKAGFITPPGPVSRKSRDKKGRDILNAANAFHDAKVAKSLFLPA
jgi:hypothetical protein